MKTILDEFVRIYTMLQKEMEICTGDGEGKSIHTSIESIKIITTLAAS